MACATEFPSSFSDIMNASSPRALEATLKRSRRPSATDSSKKRVLVVDDLPIIRHIMGSICRKLGFEVIEAENGQQCLEVFEREGKSLSCILMDLHMPVMDGWVATKQVRALETRDAALTGPETVAAHLPIVACTATALEQLTESGETVVCKALSSGMDACVTKPLDMAAMKQLISRFVPALAAAAAAGKMAPSASSNSGRSSFDTTACPSSTPGRLSLDAPSSSGAAAAAAAPACGPAPHNAAASLVPPPARPLSPQPTGAALPPGSPVLSSPMRQGSGKVLVLLTRTNSGSHLTAAAAAALAAATAAAPSVDASGSGVHLPMARSSAGSSPRR